MLYLHAGGKLSFDSPTEVQSRDDYESDPNHPVPFVGYTTNTGAAAIHGRRSALRESASGCADVRERSVGRRCDHRRTDFAEVESGEFEHGFRF